MGKVPVGVVTRFADHAKSFPWAFYEVKDVNGVHHAALPGTIPMVSVFGDNRLAKEHPEWVQIGPEGVRGDRSAPYFDWDTLCPSRDEVFRTALAWVGEAALSGKGLRLDDVTFAREGFCRCVVCEHQRTLRGLSLEEYRVARITEFVQVAQGLVTQGPLFFTLYPDPYPGHLERRFGVDPDRLGRWVDAFVVPVYDLAYTTTYWLEVIAAGFRDRLAKPFWIELYGLGVEEKRLLKAARVAGAYGAGVLIAYDNDLAKLLRIRDALEQGQ